MPRNGHPPHAARWFAAACFAIACEDAGGGTEGGSTITTAVTASTTQTSTATTHTPTTGTGSTSSSTTGPIYDVGSPETEGETDGCNPQGDAVITGTVRAPNGVLPISGALVYVTPELPTIPQTVYCSECVDLPCGTPHAFTGPDGSFELGVPPGDHNLVVQKGQFMRVTAVQVDAGETPLGPEFTDLPAFNDPPNHQYIPRIALALGDHDHLENALAKLGLGETAVSDYEEEVIPGTEQFDVWDNSPARDFPGSKGPLELLVSSSELLAQYHIIFLPCTMQAGEYPPFLDDLQVQANIQHWVADGGKWYVADWSNEAIAIPFPQYQTFWLRKDSETVDQWQDDPSADLGRYDPLGTVLDPELEAWLDALPPELQDINPQNDPQGDPYPVLDSLPDVQTVYAYSGVREVHPVLVDDGMGGQADVGHKVWIEGYGSDVWGVPPVAEKHPLSITAEFGCGRILFTAYHTVEGGGYVGLTPQELILMYLILEIGVCQIPYLPPV